MDYGQNENADVADDFAEATRDLEERRHGCL
uniref:Transcriptional regulator n=1 Tax=Steinernema glaseri TaxID=37863 RepID=A0A1I8A5P3_9BILA